MTTDNKQVKQFDAAMAHVEGWRLISTPIPGVLRAYEHANVNVGRAQLARYLNVLWVEFLKRDGSVAFRYVIGGACGELGGDD